MRVFVSFSYVTRSSFRCDGLTVASNRAFYVKLRDCVGRVQVLNVAICARPEYDLPIFCADFFSTARMNIVVL